MVKSSGEKIQISSLWCDTVKCRAYLFSAVLWNSNEIRSHNCPARKRKCVQGRAEHSRVVCCRAGQGSRENNSAGKDRAVQC